MKTSPSLIHPSPQTSLNTLCGNTTGTVDADSVNTLGRSAELNTTYDSDGIRASVTKTSPSLMHHSQQTLSTRSTATPQAPSTQDTVNDLSLVPQQISLTPPTRLTASAGLGDENIISDASTASDAQHARAKRHLTAQRRIITATLVPQRISTVAPGWWSSAVSGRRSKNSFRR